MTDLPVPPSPKMHLHARCTRPKVTQPARKMHQKPEARSQKHAMQQQHAIGTHDAAAARDRHARCSSSTQDALVPSRATVRTNAQTLQNWRNAREFLPVIPQCAIERKEPAANHDPKPVIHLDKVCKMTPLVLENAVLVRRLDRRGVLAQVNVVARKHPTGAESRVLLFLVVVVVVVLVVLVVLVVVVLRAPPGAIPLRVASAAPRPLPARDARRQELAPALRAGSSALCRVVVTLRHLARRARAVDVVVGKTIVGVQVGSIGRGVPHQLGNVAFVVEPRVLVPRGEIGIFGPVPVEFFVRHKLARKHKKHTVPAMRRSGDTKHTHGAGECRRRRPARPYSSTTREAHAAAPNRQATGQPCELQAPRTGSC